MAERAAGSGVVAPEVPLDRTSPVPLYFQVATRLEHLIESGEVPVGSRLENEVELADRLGVSRQTVNALETGRYDPSLPLAFTIAAVLEQPIEALFFPDHRGAGGSDPG